MRVPGARRSTLSSSNLSRRLGPFAWKFQCLAFIFTCRSPISYGEGPERATRMRKLYLFPRFIFLSGGAPILTLLLPVLCSLSHADETTVELRMREKAPPGMKLDLGRLSVSKGHRSEEARNGKEEYLATVHGLFQQELSHLLIDHRVVHVHPDGTFTVEIPIEGPVTPILILSVGPLGAVQTHHAEILASGLFEKSNPLQTVAKSQQTRAPASAESVVRSDSFDVSLGTSFLSYSQSNGTQLSEKAITGKLSYSHSFPNQHWSLGSSADLTLLPLSESGSSVGMRILGLEAFSQYSFSPSSPEWDLSIRAGVYSSNSLVSTNAFGYRLMAGPEIYPVISRKISSTSSLSAYAKYAPVIEPGADINFSSYAVSFGAEYDTSPSGWSFTLDYQKLGFQVNGSAEFSEMTISIGKRF